MPCFPFGKSKSKVAPQNRKTGQVTPQTARTGNSTGRTSFFNKCNPLTCCLKCCSSNDEYSLNCFKTTNSEPVKRHQTNVVAPLKQEKSPVLKKVKPEDLPARSTARRLNETVQKPTHPCVAEEVAAITSLKSKNSADSGVSLHRKSTDLLVDIFVTDCLTAVQHDLTNDSNARNIDSNYLLNFLNQSNYTDIEEQTHYIGVTSNAAFEAPASFVSIEMSNINGNNALNVERNVHVQFVSTAEIIRNSVDDNSVVAEGTNEGNNT